MERVSLRFFKYSWKVCPRTMISSTYVKSIDFMYGPTTWFTNSRAEWNPKGITQNWNNPRPGIVKAVIGLFSSVNGTNLNILSGDRCYWCIKPHSSKITFICGSGHASFYVIIDLFCGSQRRNGICHYSWGQVKCIHGFCRKWRTVLVRLGDV